MPTAPDSRPHIHFELASLQSLDAVEGRHYWSRAKSYLVRRLIQKYARKSHARILDLGCGNGLLVCDLTRQLPQATVEGFDGYKEAIENAKRRCPSANFYVGDLLGIESAMFPGKYDVVTFLDVIEHLDNPEAVLKRVPDVLAPGGILIITVPAMPMLWSARDVFLGHRKRYRRRHLNELAEAAGFTIERSNYFCSYLFLPALLIRKVLSPLFRKTGQQVEDAELRVIPILNGLLYAIGVAEAEWAVRLPIPFGTSTYCVARRR